MSKEKAKCLNRLREGTQQTNAAKWKDANVTFLFVSSIDLKKVAVCLSLDTDLEPAAILNLLSVRFSGNHFHFYFMAFCKKFKLCWDILLSLYHYWPYQANNVVSCCWPSCSLKQNSAKQSNLTRDLCKPFTNTSVSCYDHTSWKQRYALIIRSIYCFNPTFFPPPK